MNNQMNIQKKNNKYEICFLVLHFLDEKMTIQCIENIFDKFKNLSFFIVIVDNGSTNSSGEIIRNLYLNHQMVEVLISERNLGFANGNNYGYKWIKDNIICDFLCVMNNDILFCQKNVLSEIKDQYSKSKFYVLGPDIISMTTKGHQNPLAEHGMTHKELNNYFKIMKLRKYLYFIYFIKQIISNYLSSLFNVETRNNIRIDKINKILVDPVLQGSCYFFSRNYMENKDDLFNTHTFMYFEEFILHYECKKNDFNMIYYPNISVLHCESVSTKVYFNNAYRRGKWVINESLKSASYYKKLISEDERKGIVVFDD